MQEQDYFIISKLIYVFILFTFMYFNNTVYFCLLKVRKLLDETIRRLIHKRRENNDYGGGLLGVLLRAWGYRIKQLIDYLIISLELYLQHMIPLLLESVSHLFD